MTAFLFSLAANDGYMKSPWPTLFVRMLGRGLSGNNAFKMAALSAPSNLASKFDGDDEITVKSTTLFNPMAIHHRIVSLL